MRAYGERSAFLSSVMGRLVICTVISLSVFLCAAYKVEADSNVSGPIGADTTWTLSNSPYIVTGNVLVSSGVTLTIQPGVTIKFDGGRSLQIDGTLVARGTEMNKITFTSNLSTPVPGDWGYILFSNSSADAIYDQDGMYTGGSIMEYVTVEYAGGVTVAYNGAVKFDNAHPFINHTTIRNSAQSGIFGWGLTGTLKIMNSLFTNNISTEQGGGVRINGSGNVALINNTITNNSTAGAGGGIDIGGGLMTIAGNTVRGNRSDSWGGGVYLWGGNTDSATISSNIISNNTGYGGGGLYVAVTATISGNVVVNNAATASTGGGILANEGGSWGADYPVTITNSIFSGNTAEVSGGGIGIVVGDNGLITNGPISGNTISGNVAPNSPAIYTEGSNSFAHNTITGNRATGTAPTSAIYIASTLSIFNNNNIFNNATTYELWNNNAQGSTAIDATKNWWGTATDVAVQTKIYDWLDDSTKGFVTYSPYSLVIRTDVPISPPNGLTAVVGTNQISLTWASNSEDNLVGYRVHWRTASGFPYEHSVDVGNSTSYVINNPVNKINYIAVTAYNTSYNPANDNPNTIVNDNQTNGNESWYLDEKMADLTSPLYTTFTGYGLYKYFNSMWTRVDTLEPASMAASGSTLYAAYTGIGLYKYDGITWTRIDTVIPANMAASGSTLYAAYTGIGLYKYDGITWTRIDTVIPANMAASGSTLYAAYTGIGLYKYDGITWTRIDTVIPANMAASGSTLYATYSGYGLYKCDGTTWTRIDTIVPASIVASGSTLYAAYTGSGLYKYDGTTWTRIDTIVPASMIASESTLYAVFAGIGLYKYDGATWACIDTTIPVGMASGS